MLNKGEFHMTNYELLIAQVQGLLEEKNKIAALSNVTACINQNMDTINWVGFYFIDNDELILGPFQGKVACTHLKIGKGVCGTAVATKQTQLIPNVHTFAGHIACDSASESELVIPIFLNDQVIAVLDIDSPILERFTVQDASCFEAICKKISEAYSIHNWK